MFRYFHWYGLLLGLGILASLQISLWYAKTVGVKQRVVEKAFWWVLIAGLVGARAYHLIDWWQEYYRFNILKSLFLWEGGLGIWGGIAGGIVGLMGYKLSTKFHLVRDRLRRRPLKRQEPSEEKFSFLRLLDVTAIGVPLGQAIGRLGNRVNGELYGKSGEPLFAWEAGLNLILLTVLLKMAKKNKVAGKITGGYLIGYGLIRVMLENFRPAEMIWRLQEIPVAIIMGIVSIILGGVIFLKGKQL